MYILEPRTEIATKHVASRCYSSECRIEGYHSHHREEPAELLFVGDGRYSFARKVYLANPSDRYDHESTRFVISFEFETHVMVWADSLDDAVEIAAEFAMDHWPGFDLTEDVSNAYREALAELGTTPDDATEEQSNAAQESAETDVTCSGDGRWYSNDWTYTEICDRAALESFLYPHGIRHCDGSTERWPAYQPTREQWMAA